MRVSRPNFASVFHFNRVPGDGRKNCPNRKCCGKPSVPRKQDSTRAIVFDCPCVKRSQRRDEVGVPFLRGRIIPATSSKEALPAEGNRIAPRGLVCIACRVNSERLG